MTKLVKQDVMHPMQTKTMQTTVVTLMLVGLLINPKNGDPFKSNKQLR